MSSYLMKDLEERKRHYISLLVHLLLIYLQLVLLV